MDGVCVSAATLELNRSVHVAGCGPIPGPNWRCLRPWLAGEFFMRERRAEQGQLLARHRPGPAGTEWVRFLGCCCRN
jgi:hypothetical protein